MLPPEFIAKLVSAKLSHSEITVESITNKFGNVGRKEMRGNYLCFEIVRAPLRQLKPACKELGIPFAPYVQGWTRLRGVNGQKWQPQFAGIVVRRDHAEQLMAHLKGRIEHELELELFSPAVSRSANCRDGNGAAYGTAGEPTVRS